MRFDNKKIRQIIYMVFVTGIALLFLSGVDMGGKREESVETPTEIEEMETRMERALGLVDGVGDVRVIINYNSSAAKVLAKNKTEEIDDTRKRFEENIVLGSDNSPVVLRENAREVRGVLIVAQGGGSAKVRAELISATQALLGVEAHKIEVLKMRSQEATK